MATTGLNGSIPQMNQGGFTPGQKALFHSVRDIALVKDKTVKSGYGYLAAGTLMAVNTADGDLYPYPEASAAVNAGNGKAFVAVNAIATELAVVVLNSQAVKFKVGDSLILMANALTAEDLGAIVSIVPSETTGLAVITVTTAISAETGFTVANNAHVYLKGDASAPFTKAVYVLDKDTYTGVGDDAAGAVVSVVISNAILYLAALVNFDSAAATDLGTVTDGPHVILK